MTFNPFFNRDSTSSSQISLNNIENNYQVSITSKTREDPEEGSHRRHKEICLLYLFIFGAVIAYLGCVLVIVFKTNNELSSVGLNGIIGLTSALAGYYVRGRN